MELKFLQRPEEKLRIVTYIDGAGDRLGGDRGGWRREGEVGEEVPGYPEDDLVLGGEVSAHHHRAAVLVAAGELGTLRHPAHLPGQRQQPRPEVDLGHVLLQHHLRPEESLANWTLKYICIEIDSN